MKRQGKRWMAAMLLGYFWMNGPNLRKLPDVAVEISALIPDTLVRIVESLLFSW